MICWWDEPINRNTLSFWWTSSKCMRSLNCNTLSAGYLPLGEKNKRKFEKSIMILSCWIVTKPYTDWKSRFGTSKPHTETKWILTMNVFYPSGLFLAMFNDFKSSIFIELIRAHCDHCDRSTPFDVPLCSRCNVCLCKITNCPHFVISKSNRIFWHDCSTHCEWHNGKDEKRRRIDLVWVRICRNKLNLKTKIFHSSIGKYNFWTLKYKVLSQYFFIF